MNFPFQKTCQLVVGILLASISLSSVHSQKANTRQEQTQPTANKHHHQEPHHHAHSSDVRTTRDGARVLPPVKADDVFHFMVYGDRTGGVPAGLNVLKQAVEDTNLLDPDMVMTVGDLIQGYNEKPEWIRQMREFKGIMDKLKMKWYPVAGNHDVYWRGEGDAPQGHHESNYEEHFGPLWYCFEHKNCGFIVLYSDEGDPETNRKGFSQGALQTMSDEQLAFLDQSLEELNGLDHVFVFLHHPRWTGRGYAGGNWKTVHQKLLDAGNVSAVFAGHIHHMRYDPKDGIDYFTLATTGGHLNGNIPGAGYLHHMNIVTVRPNRISVSAIPVGTVMDPRDFTSEFLAEIELARTIRPVQKTPNLTVQVDGSVEGEVLFTIKNPCKASVSVTAMLDVDRDARQWQLPADHMHFTLEPAESREFRMPLTRVAGNLDSLAVPQLRMQPEYIGKSARIELEEVVFPMGLRLGDVPDEFFADAKPKALKVSGESSAIRVDSASIKMEDGPMTLEAWVRPNELAGYNGIIAKTQSSEYAFFCDQGVPKFDIFLDGSYVSAKATNVLSRDKWTHLAGVFDGEQVLLFVDGKLVDKTAASGKRRFNDLPLFIGADPNGRGAATRAFSGMIDEVRLSSTNVYQSEFEPDRRLQRTSDTVLLLHLDKKVGPYVFDRSEDRVKAFAAGKESQLVPVDNQ